jgi:membrane-associated protease RseP (regulator of RpoE activity)
LQRFIVSSPDSSPAPYSSYAESFGGHVRPVPAVLARERYWLHVLLFSLTLLSTTIVGASMQMDFDRNLPFDVGRSMETYLSAWGHAGVLWRGLPYSLALMAILLAHELGHYLTALFHGVNASPPFFMPSPMLGTLGAFIRVRSQIYSKLVLFDIGISGPLAGFIVLAPTLAIGLAFSKVIPGIGRQGPVQFGVPALQWLMERAIFPGTHSSDICLHPVARAAWVGMLATAMNLLPVGQLDGGHILYAFFPNRHLVISKVACALLLPLGLLWWPWALWALVLFWLGRRHPAVYDDAPLTPGRRRLGWLSVAMFALCFIYLPESAGGL